MKTKRFFSVLATLVGVAALTLSSCSKEEPSGDVTLTLDKSTATVGAGQTITITATITPEVTGAIVTWSSSKPEVATVSGTLQSGTVTGVAEGTAVITATYGGVSKTCAVQVTNTATHASLLGSDYYIIQLDAQSRDLIADKIIADYAPDEENIKLDIWPDGSSYQGGTPSGKNCYGTTEGWPVFVVQSIGWSGAGYSVGATDPSIIDALATVYQNAADYTLHIAIKGTQNVSHLFGFDGTVGKGCVVLGPTSFNDNGTEYQPYADYTHDGEWNHFDIPVSYLVNQGWTVTTGNTAAKNLMFMLSGGVTGTQLQYDAVFFYKQLAQ